MGTSEIFFTKTTLLHHRHCQRISHHQGIDCAWDWRKAHRIAPTCHGIFSLLISILQRRLILEPLSNVLPSLCDTTYSTRSRSNPSLILSFKEPQWRFARIPFADAQPNGKWVDELYTDPESLICEYCGVQMERIIESDNSQHYRHVLFGEYPVIKAMNCRYQLLKFIFLLFL